MSATLSASTLLIVPMAAAHLLTVSPPTGNNAVALAHASRVARARASLAAFGHRFRRSTTPPRTPAPAAPPSAPHTPPPPASAGSRSASRKR